MTVKYLVWQRQPQKNLLDSSENWTPSLYSFEMSKSLNISFIFPFLFSVVQDCIIPEQIQTKKKEQILQP